MRSRITFSSKIQSNYITCDFRNPDLTAEESSEDEDENEVTQKTNVKPKKPVEDDMEVEDGWSVAR